MDELSQLAVQHHSEKLLHGFTALYHRVLAERRGAIRKVLEIGVLHGASVKMWRDYLPAAEIHGADIVLPEMDDPSRITLHRADQANRDDLARLAGAVGVDIDLLIDDGGHTMEQQQVTLGVLFRLVRPGGLYVVEDLHTSFMDEVRWYLDGKVHSSYPTGVGEGVLTTYDFLVSLSSDPPKQSPFMTDDEHRWLIENLAGIDLFDRDGDRRNMLAILHRRQQAGAG